MSAEDGENAAGGDDVERLRAERDALRAEVVTLRARRRWTGAARRVGVVVLVVLASLSLTAATVAVWANRTLLSTEGWVETVGPLGADPTVTGALQPRVTEAVFTVIPAEELIAEALPDDLRFLAVPLSTAVRDFVDEQAGALLSSPEFAQLWVEANRFAHERALEVLRGESDVVVVEDEAVTLSLLPVINGVLRELSGVASGLVGENVTLPTITSGQLPEDARAELNAALGMELPEDLGEIPVYDADELIIAQQALRLFDQALVALVVATPLLVSAALWLSTDRRRTLLQLSVGSVLLLVLTRRVLLRLFEDLVALPPRPAGRSAVQVVVDQVFGGLFALTAAVIAVGLVLVVLALVTGPYRWAVALRRGTVQVGRVVADSGARVAAGADVGGGVAWAVERRSALQVGGVLVVVGVLLLFDVSWGWFLALVALLAAWEVVLWRLGGPDASAAAEAP